MSVIDLSHKGLKLEDLVRHDEVTTPHQIEQGQTISRLALRAQDVEEGDVFLALPSLKAGASGLEYLTQAVEKKAAVVLKEATMPSPSDQGSTRFIDVYDARQLKARLAHRIFKGQPRKVVAVTGTNGKTSVVEFARQLFSHLGCKAASIGTLGTLSDIKLQDMPELDHTTPDPFELHLALSKMKEQGVTHVALEASSHGLDQRRLDAVDFTAAGFTNLTQDHLDYHPTMDHYFEAKKRLFTKLLPEGETAVLNADTNFYDDLMHQCRARGQRVIGYGKRADEGLKLVDLAIRGPHQVIKLETNHREYEFDVNFIGKFQVLNALCAAGLVMGTGVSAMDVLPLLPKLNTIPGRLELMGVTKAGGAVYVDYAHTPDALSEALLSVRPYVSGMLTLLFGCGGDRDATKRVLMGNIAAEYSDAQIITNDNPRTEDPDQIRATLAATCTNPLNIADRGEAIAKGIKRLGKNDAILIAGKGHEDYQIIGSKKVPFSDRALAQELILEGGGEVF